MLSYDPEGTEENNVTAMTDALDQVDTMQITYAARDSDFDGQEIHQGDYLAMYNKALFATSRDLNTVLRSLAEKVRDSGRGVYHHLLRGGHHRKAGLQGGRYLLLCLSQCRCQPAVWGQPVYYYLISAE